MVDMTSSLKGTVFNVQRYTVHDGPGTRTQVFLKGCPLRCVWCDNPESWKHDPEVGVYPKRCIDVEKCGLCMTVCPVDEGDIFEVKDKHVTAIDRNLCTGCLKCAEICPANALTVWGKRITAADQIEEVCEDRAFFEETGGGITLSGGEPFVQMDFTLALLRESKKRKLHTCVESALPVSWESLEAALPFIDFFITDIKHMDPNKHLAYTGVSSERILDNIIKLSTTGIPMVVRIPVVPGHNDSKENIRETAAFLRHECQKSITKLELLPYHELGKMKYDALGKTYALEGERMPSAELYREQLDGLIEIVHGYGF